jgi:hypothetical protein
MNRAFVYLETSFVSYLTARPSRDIIVTAHQAITREWWAQKRDAFEVVIAFKLCISCGTIPPEGGFLCLIN